MKEIVVRIKQIEKEQERRGTDALARYNSGRIKHKKQLAFHKNKCRNRWVFGGNRSGKTECGAVETVYFALCRHPHRKTEKSTTGWVVSLSREVQRDVAQAKILKYLPKNRIAETVMIEGKKGSPEYGIIDYILVKNDTGGLSRIGFKSCDQGREKFQGASLDYVWFDEEPPKEIYEECRMRVFDRCGDLFGTMTPLKGLTFVYDDIYLKADGMSIWCEVMEWADNPYLSESEIKKMSEEMPADLLNTRRYGRFSSGSGLVYPEFDINVHVIEPFSVPKEWYDNISIDPGLNNPLSCHFYAVDYDGNIYVIAEHYEAGKDVDYHAAAIKRIAIRLGWHTSANGNISSLIDSAAGQRTLASSKSVADLFYGFGISCSTKVNKDVFSGIARVKSYLNPQPRPKLFIFKSCANMIREIKGYFWGEGDSPKKRDDHAMDELRYYIMSRPEAKIRKEEKSVVIIDIEKRVRRLKKQGGVCRLSDRGKNG